MPTKNKIKKNYPKLKLAWKKINNRGNYQKPNERLFNGVKELNKLEFRDVNALDIGCNCGILSAVASKKFNKIVGIDTDPHGRGVIKKAKVTANFFKRKNCFFYDISFLDYIESGQYKKDEIKALIGFQILYHLNDKEVGILRNMLPDITFLIISVRPEMGGRIEPGNPANELGLYNIEQVTEFFSPFFAKIKIHNTDTRWPTLIINR